MFFSPSINVASKEILPLIQEAKKTIDIWMFLLTHNKISEELVNAKKRGVKVRIILDTAQTRDVLSKHDYLDEKDIEVKVESWGGHMHIKAAVIDNKHIVLGSMNWTLDSVKKNDENTIIINNSPKLSLQLSSLFNEMWNSHPNSWTNWLINKIKFY